jgi:mono/diheme cytochrome c family protein
MRKQRCHLRVWLGVSCAAAALSWAVAGCSKPAQHTPGKAESAALSLTGDAQRGLVVFDSICITCHGERGRGGIPNPGSKDGTVPRLTPIDPAFVSPDRATFARNIDRIIEHGSRPDGPNPTLKMPAFGDEKKLTPQQIADVIAFIIAENSK